MDTIQKVMDIIANAGEGKSFAMMSIQKARAGEYEDAEKSLQQAKESVLKSHTAHSELLFHSAENQDLNVTLLMVHAADHLTSADMIKELAEEIIFMYKEMRNV